MTHPIDRRTVLKTLGSATVAGGAVVGAASAQGRARYDPLPDEPGVFLGPVRGDDPRYAGPPDNEQPHVNEGCNDFRAPNWFCAHFCPDTPGCSGRKVRR